MCRVHGIHHLLKVLETESGARENMGMKHNKARWRSEHGNQAQSQESSMVTQGIKHGHTGHRNKGMQAGKSMENLWFRQVVYTGQGFK